MRRSTVLLNLAVALTAWAAATPAAAQPLGQATRLLCSTASAVVCYDDGECESGPSWLWNIPDFVEVDHEAAERGRVRVHATGTDDGDTPGGGHQVADPGAIAVGQGADDGSHGSSLARSGR